MRRFKSFLCGFLMLPTAIAVMVALGSLVYLVSELTGFVGAAACVVLLMSIGMGLLQVYGPFEAVGVDGVRQAQTDHESADCGEIVSEEEDK